MALPRLTKITFEKCPECGCRDIGSVRLGNGVGIHTCGEWREFITFRCGSEYEYTPNFSKIVNNKPCQKEGVNEATVDVTVRLTLRVRKDIDLSTLDPKEMFQIPGAGQFSGGLSLWQARDRLKHQRNSEVIRVERIKTTKIKKKK